MFSEENLNKVYEHYKSDKEMAIDISSFKNASLHTLLKTLILYKELDDSILGYSFNLDEKYPDNVVLLQAHNDTADTHLGVQNYTNALTFYPSDVELPEWFNKDEWYDELMSTFLNRQMVGDTGSDEKCAVYINDEEHSTYIMVPKYLSIAGMQSVLSGLVPKLLPWFFKNVDKEVVKQIATLSNERDYMAFENFFETTIRHAEIMQRIMEDDLNKLGEEMKRKEKSLVQDKIIEYQRQVDSYYQDMCRVNNVLRDMKNRLKAITMSDDRDSGVSEIVEFLKSTTQDIVIDRISELRLYLRMRVTLQQFDEWEEYTNMDSCYLYNELDRCDIPEYRRMYTKLFSDPNFKIHTNVGVSIDLEDGMLNCFDPDCDAFEIGHPHLNSNFSCFGTAAAPIAEYIRSFRYTEALNQILYAAKQFTVSDGAAGDKLIYGIEHNECIELPSGEFVNADGLRQYLNETEGEMEDE